MLLSLIHGKFVVIAVTFLYLDVLNTVFQEIDEAERSFNCNKNIEETDGDEGTLFVFLENTQLLE